MEYCVDLLNDHMYVVVVAILCLAALAGSIIRSLTTVATSQAKERSRREIAAYIAEGSITPDQGERLMKADVNAEGRRHI